MADKATQNAVWNAYFNKHNCEPSNPQQLLNFSKNKANNVAALGFLQARNTFNRNQGKGKITIKSSNNINTNSTSMINSKISSSTSRAINKDASNKQNGGLDVDLSKVTGEEIDVLLTEIEQTEVLFHNITKMKADWFYGVIFQIHSKNMEMWK